MKSSVEKLLEKLNAIEKVEECLEICSKDQFYIKDINGTAILTDTCIDLNFCFSILNSLLSKIHFIPVDGDGGIIGDEMECCEAVIFNNENFSFLELKLNAISNKRRAVYKNRIKAVEQLENTIQFFNNKLNNNYKGLSLEAIIATPAFYPRADASWRDIAVQFADENNGIPLFESIEKTYS